MNIMILTDYLLSKHDIIWDYAKQTGVTHGTVRLPDDKCFDITCAEHWKSIYDDFMGFGIKPIVIEPLPNNLNDHIKIGDNKRDECIEKVIRMFKIMDKLDIRTLCFNFMAHIGWTRTSDNISERGGAKVTGFSIKDFTPPKESITHDQLWANYKYFIKAVMPYADKHNIKLALHPDDPPISNLGNIARIMTSYENIKKAVNIVESKNLGITMCQATFYIMGENVYQLIPRIADKIFFIHFRNAVGNKNCFHETFHDNGDLDMPRLIKLYLKNKIDVPIRVDHVPTLAQENTQIPGYAALGRLYAIGYLKGLIESTQKGDE